MIPSSVTDGVQQYDRVDLVRKRSSAIIRMHMYTYNTSLASGASPIGLCLALILWLRGLERSGHVCNVAA